MSDPGPMWAGRSLELRLHGCTNGGSRAAALRATAAAPDFRMGRLAEVASCPARAAPHILRGLRGWLDWEARMQPIDGVRLPPQRPLTSSKRERIAPDATRTPARPAQPAGDAKPAEGTGEPRVSDRDLGIWFG